MRNLLSTTKNFSQMKEARSATKNFSHIKKAQMKCGAHSFVLANIERR